jgi:hypothetical protein
MGRLRPALAVREEGPLSCAHMPIDDHTLVNRATWDEDAPNWVQRGREAWAREEPVWGRGSAQAQPYIPLEWAGRWPSAEAWKVRKLG